MSEIQSPSQVEDIKLLNEIVIVEPIEEQEYKGIIIPDSLKESGQKGLVHNVGPGTKDIEMEVKPGDIIFYCKYAGSEIKVENKKFMIMKQEDILGIFNGERKIDVIPLEDRVLIEWERGQDAYQGTTILRPEGASKERYYTGIVMSIGSQVKELQIGDRIFFDQFCGPERIDFEQKRYAMIFEKDAYCIIPHRKNIMVLSH